MSRELLLRVMLLLPSSLVQIKFRVVLKIAVFDSISFLRQSECCPIVVKSECGIVPVNLLYLSLYKRVTA